MTQLAEDSPSIAKISIAEAADLLTLGGPDKDIQHKMILGSLLRAAEAGNIAAEKVEPWTPMPLVLSGGNQRRAIEKTITSKSPIKLYDACTWRSAQGHEIPKRARDLLSPSERERLSSTFKPPAEHGGAKLEKVLLILGATLQEVAPHLPPKLRNRDGINISMLAQAIGERVREEQGSAHGFGETTVSNILKEALDRLPLTAAP